MEEEALRIRVRCDSFAPKLVRAALQRLPETERARDDALLVASELVTNAVRHSHGTEQQQLTISAHCHGRRMRIAVLDPGISGIPARIVERPAGGLGLKIVEQLSERWGAERGPDGYEVWAELPLAA